MNKIAVPVITTFLMLFVLGAPVAQADEAAARKSVDIIVSAIHRGDVDTLVKMSTGSYQKEMMKFRNQLRHDPKYATKLMDLWKRTKFKIKRIKVG